MPNSSALSGSQASFRGRGFTIIEVLVVVAIIAALTAILVLTFGHVHRSAEKAAALQQLGGLQSALQAYYTDFGAYPPSELLVAGGYGNIPPNRGSVMLAQGLMGFLPDTQDGFGPETWPPPVGYSDSAFGFRTRSYTLGGRVYGPYASSDHKTYLRKNPLTEEFFIDPWGNEILYFRATSNPAGGNTRIFGPFGATNCFFIKDDCTVTTAQLPTFPGGAPIPDPSQLPTPASMAGFFNTIRASGSGNNGYLNGGTLMGSDSYLLISAGPDGIYFTADDVVVGKP